MAHPRGHTMLFVTFLFMFSVELRGILARKVIRVGHLSGYTSLPKNAAAISLAVEQFHKEGRLLDYEFEISYNLSGCYPHNGLAGAIDLVNNKNVDVILGPFCSTVCIPTGYLLRYHNILYMPSSCTSVDMNDKTVFNTLVRTNAGMDKAGIGMVELLEDYKWNRVIIWTADCCTCAFGADSMEEEFPTVNITVGERIREKDVLPSGTEAQLRLATIEDRLRRIRERGRIVFLCFNAPDVAQIMEMAAEKGMVGPDYVYVWYINQPLPLMDTPWMASSNPAINKDIFYSLKLIHFALLDIEDRNRFYQEMRERLSKPPWNEPDQTFATMALTLYDAMYLYLMVLEETINAGNDYRNGRLLAKKTKGRGFKGKSGNVVIGQNMDRLPDYVLKQFKPGDDHFKIYGELRMDRNDGDRYNEIEKPYWRTVDGNPPPSFPECGYKNELCPQDYGKEQTIVISLVIVVAVLIITASGVFYYNRKKKLEEELHQMLWQIPASEIEFRNIVMGSVAAISIKSQALLSVHSGQSHDNTTLSDTHNHARDLYGNRSIALYKGQLVVVKRFHNVPLLNRMDLIELKRLKDMSHNNTVQFIGACVTSDEVWVISTYCSKGSLQDILENDDIKLDWMFKTSLVTDLVNGMCYIHDSPFISHGHLKSSVCVVDGRWVLKVTGFGLAAFKSAIDKNQTGYERNRDLLWTAPELLRCDPRPVYGSQAGDVYSFAIILQEILYRSLPYHFGTTPPEDIIRRVRDTENPPFRPEVPQGAGEEAIAVELMKKCWNESPNLRPTFKDIRRMIRKFGNEQKMDIMDVMLDKLERYATNLEEIVTKRTSELVEEKKKTDLLLYRMLPRSVAEKLKTGNSVEAELYDNVTIYFSDIVGFTTISSESTPMQVVDLLNDLYTLFDNIIDNHQVYKVETIGDAYMVVSGLPITTPRHAANIADMALELLNGTQSFKVHHLPEKKLLLRIGIHTGSCAAGIVGHVMPRYCLFGDTVNVASRMESTGEALRVHTSERTHKELSSFNVYTFIDRGLIDIKGKGSTHTYWLTGKQGQTITDKNSR